MNDEPTGADDAPEETPPILEAASDSTAPPGPRQSEAQSYPFQPTCGVCTTSEALLRNNLRHAVGEIDRHFPGRAHTLLRPALEKLLAEVVEMVRRERAVAGITPSRAYLATHETKPPRSLAKARPRPRGKRRGR